MFNRKRAQIDGAEKKGLVRPGDRIVGYAEDWKDGLLEFRRAMEEEGVV